MSYVRWGNYSDVYVYEGGCGFITHVGRVRRRVGGPRLGWAFGKEHLDTYWHKKLLWWRYKAFVYALKVYNLIFPLHSIGLSHDGETFSHDTPGLCAENLVRLKAMGYTVPQRAIKDLFAEQRELGGSS